MSKSIVYTRPDGGVSVVRPHPPARLIWIETAPGAEPEALPAFTIPRLREVDVYLQESMSWPREAFAESEDEFMDRLRARHVPADATDVRVVDDGRLPDKFRSSRRPDLSIDMVRAREEHRNELRDRRAKLFLVLDAEMQPYQAKSLTGALTAADRKAVANIEAKRQALRDVTNDPAIEAASTPEELAQVMPAALAGA